MDPASPSPIPASAGATDPSAPEQNLPDLLLRPLGPDSEMREILRSELQERLANTLPQDGEDTPHVVAARLAKKKTQTHPKRPARWWLVTGLAMASAAMLGIMLWQAWQEVAPVLALRKGAADWLRQDTFREMCRPEAGEIPENVFLDTGDPWIVADSVRRWREHPDSPVAYADYIRHRMREVSRWQSGLGGDEAFRGEKDLLPEDYDETWRRLDPDNGYWLMQRAITVVDTDEAQARQLLEQAMAAPCRDTYDLAVMRRRQDAFLRPVTMGQAMALHTALVSRGVDRRSFPGMEPNWRKLTAMVFALDKEGEEDNKLIYEILGTFADFSGHDFWFRGMAKLYLVDGDWKDAPRDLRVIAWWRLETALLAVLLWLGAVVAALRGLPRTGRQASLIRCISPLLRTWPCVVVAAGTALAAVWAGHACLKAVLNSTQDEEVALLPPLAGAVVLTVLIVGMARRAVRRRAGFLGLRPGRAGGKRAGTPAVVGVVAALAGGISALITGLCLLQSAGMTGGDGRVGEGVEPLGTRLAEVASQGMVQTELWLAAALGLCLVLAFLLGYGKPEQSLRHRLMAVQMVPALLAAGLVFAIAAAGSQILEGKVAARLEVVWGPDL